MTKKDFLSCKPFQYDMCDDVYVYNGSGKILLKSKDGMFHDYCNVDDITNLWFESNIPIFGMNHRFIMMYKRCKV